MMISNSRNKLAKAANTIEIAVLTKASIVNNQIRVEAALTEEV